LVCRYAGIQSDYMSEQCMMFLVDYVSSVWQAGIVSATCMSTFFT